jgi:hypothetical protein
LESLLRGVLYALAAGRSEDAVIALREAHCFQTAVVLSAVRLPPQHELVAETWLQWAAHLCARRQVVQGVLCYVVAGETATARRTLERELEQQSGLPVNARNVALCEGITHLLESV